MKAGDKITFAFGNGEKEGVIERLTPKKAYLRVDFPHHRNKLITRKIAALAAGPATDRAKKKKVKEKKREKGK